MQLLVHALFSIVLIQSLHISVVEGNGMKILCDFDIRTDNTIPTRRPDIVVVDYNQRNGIIVFQQMLIKRK